MCHNGFEFSGYGFATRVLTKVATFSLPGWRCFGTACHGAATKAMSTTVLLLNGWWRSGRFWTTGSWIRSGVIGAAPPVITSDTSVPGTGLLPSQTSSADSWLPSTEELQALEVLLSRGSVSVLNPELTLAKEINLCKKCVDICRYLNSST